MQFQSILERQNRKTLSIAISRNGQVIIKAPLSMPIGEIQRFVASKQQWIESKLLATQNILNQNADLTSYKKFLFLGSRVTPYFADVRTCAIDDSMRLLVPKSTREPEVLATICRFYKKEAKRILCERVKTICETMGTKPKAIRFTNAKSRWGSCSSGGVIALNYRIIMLPPSLIDYVIVHELCHLYEMNHSARFWNGVGRYLPNYSILRKDLKNYSFVLNLLR